MKPKYRLVELTQQKYALIDSEDHARITKYKWHITTGGYACRTGGILMHHEVFGKPFKGYEVDHINQDKLDNRKSNLRFVTISENRKNVPKRKSQPKSWRFRERQFPPSYKLNLP